MSDASRCTVELAQGTIIGTESNGLRRFLGVRYAEPPVGSLRFRAPLPVRPSGPHDGTVHGPACPQQIGPRIFGVSARAPRFTEDCLRLNVWTPRPDGVPRPVLVWIHGGAFLTGSAHMYGGAALAAEQDVVVVTIQYRLGVLGFVNVGALGGESETNLGLRDQLCALRWVHDNIAAFGGDPARVTIFGESAGSMSVSLHMLHRPADALYQGAIMQSGALSLIHDRDMSERVAKAYGDVLSLGARPLDGLRALSPKALLLAQQAVQRRMPGTIPAAPWFDGDYLPRSLSDAHATPTNPVPLLAGFNRDEIRFFDAIPGLDILPARRPTLQALAEAQLGSAHAARLASAYAGSRRAESAYATHATFGMPTLHFAERHSAHAPTWFYRFDMAHPLIGAAHAQDLFYLWDIREPYGTLARGGRLIGPRRALADRMRSAWCAFARDGEPGRSWPRFDTSQRLTRLFDREDRVVADPERAQRTVWEGADVGAGLTQAYQRRELAEIAQREAVVARILEA